MKLGQTLASAPATRYLAIGVHGQPVFSNHVQLKAALTQRFGPGHAACFAKPDQDPRDETIRWIAEVPGEAKRWVDMTPGEQALAALTLEGIRADLAGYVAEIRSQSSDGGARSFAALLEQAVIIPDDTHLHFIGDQPILSFWGFEVAKGQGINALGLAPPPLAPVAPVAAAAVPVAEEPPRRPMSWLWWLLPLLLLLFLLFLAWLYWGQGWTTLRFMVPPAISEALKPDPAPADPAKPDAVLPEVKPDPVPDPLVVPDPVPDPVVVPVQPGIVTPVQPDGTGVVPVPETVPVVPPDVTRPDVTAPEPVRPDSAVTPDAVTPPRPPVVPSEGVTPPQGAVPPAGGPPLAIPPEALRSGDAGFLRGQWQSRRGLVDHVTGEALVQYYRFNQQGVGEAIVRRADGVECKGPARGVIAGGKLTLQEQGDLVCPDGRTYSRAETVCERTASGVTACRGINPDGSSYRVGLDQMP